jgi:very-long-chain (3R)-3-hydroxyacyl-CoA dehydratase
MSPPSAPLSRRSPSVTVKAYLVLYNVLCVLGWLFINLEIARHFVANDGLRHPERLWAAVGGPLKLMLSAALLEVAHAALGLVRAPVAVAFVQVAARLIVLSGYVAFVPAAQQSWPFVAMAAAWAAGEVPRYSFYVAGLLAPTKEAVPYALRWLRYSLFLVLYPVGIAGEVGSLVYCLEPMRKYAFELGLAVRMPNRWNFAYDHYVLLLCLFPLYVPGSIFMVGNMLRSRKRELLSKEAKAS